MSKDEKEASMDKEEGTNDEHTKDILKIIKKSSTSKLEQSLLELNKNDNVKDNKIRNIIDTCFLARVCESLSSFPSERLLPKSEVNNKDNELEKEEKEVEDKKQPEIDSDTAKKRAKFEKSDTLGLVSDIASILSEVSKHIKDKEESLHLTVSDVVDRCTKNISDESIRKSILETIGQEMPCFGVKDAECIEAKRLTRMLAKVLLAILSEVQLLHTLYEKFDGIWKGLKALDHADLEVAREIAWTMQSILSVDRFAGADYRISLMAASSYIAAVLCHVLAVKPNKAIKTEDSKFNLSIEEEAISALSMMPTSGSSTTTKPKDMHEDHFKFLQIIATHTNLTIDDIQHNVSLISDIISTHLSSEKSNKRKQPDNADLPSNLHQLFPFVSTRDNCTKTNDKLKSIYKDLCVTLYQSLLSNESGTLVCDETPDFFHSLALLMLDESKLFTGDELFSHLSTNASIVNDMTKQMIKQDDQAKVTIVPQLPQASPSHFDTKETNPSPITNTTTDTNLSFDPSHSFFQKFDEFSSVSSAQQPIVMDYISLIDWTCRLHNDPIICKPSRILLSYFHTADNMMSLPTTTTSGSSFGIWNDIVTLLNFTFTKLLKNLHYEQSNKLCKIEVMPSGDLLFQNLTDNDNGQHQQKVFTSLLSLYYYSLENLLTKESIRLHQSTQDYHDFGKLLNNFTFHRSLLSVCIECVLKSLACNTINFTNVLSLMDVDPFEFLKVCEGFVRALTFPITQHESGGWQMENVPPPIGLPETLRSHLQQREEQILDSLVWIYKQDNAVTNTYTGNFAAEIADMQQHEDEEESSSWPPTSLLQQEHFDLSIKDIIEQSSIHNASNIKWKKSSTTQQSKQQLQRHSAVSFVFRKLIKLTARRIYKLCQKLCLIDPVVDVIWKAWKYFLSNNVHLLYNRHVDQLILCTVYGVCRVIKVVPEVSFVRIIDCYQMVNPGREKLNNKIARKVRLRTTGIDKAHPEHGNVITLYNQIYVPVMKKFLLENQKFDFLKMQEQKAKQQVKTVEDAAMIADRAASTASILHELGGRKKAAVAVSPSTLSSTGFDSDASPARVPNSKIFVTASSSAGYRCGRLAAMRKNFAMPRTRAIYNFGDSSSKVK